jgi:serine/threonine-protein kinase RsbW
MLGMTHDTRKKLSLTSSLAELAQVPSWVGEIADANGISQEGRFAIELCLEEVLSNIVRHGYRGEPGHDLAVDCSVKDGKVFFAVEDHGPPFEPAPPGESEIQHLNEITPGGQGVRLLYHFAESVHYERIVGGNRLTLGFPLPAKS